MTNDEIADHYASGQEATRLIRSMHGRLEFLRTQELVRRFLPLPPARVLDVGGATGIHARWLANDGYQVHVVDIVDHHVESAASLPGVTAEVGDARKLASPTGSIDAVLLLGPLYHLTGAHDRELALRECHRVLRPRGVIFAAAISRYLGVMDPGSGEQLTPEVFDSIRATITSGDYDGRSGFVSSHWHTADELRHEFQMSGFRDVEVFGIEGPAWATLDAYGEEAFEQHRDVTLECARLVEQDPLLMHASAHLLAVGVA